MSFSRRPTVFIRVSVPCQLYIMLLLTSTRYNILAGFWSRAGASGCVYPCDAVKNRMDTIKEI